MKINTLKLIRYLKSERGNVESSLTLIPLLLLFLCGVQIISAIYIRNGDQISVQNEASVRAISGNLASGDEVVQLASKSGNFGQKVLLTHKSGDIPILIPGITGLLGRNIKTSLNGFAIMEVN